MTEVVGRWGGDDIVVLGKMGIDVRGQVPCKAVMTDVEEKNIAKQRSKLKSKRGFGQRSETTWWRSPTSQPHLHNTDPE